MSDKHDKKDEKHKDEKHKEEKHKDEKHKEEKHKDEKHKDEKKEKKEKKDKGSRVVLITGLTGNTGSATLRSVLEHKKSSKWTIRAGTRDAEKAKEKLKDLSPEQLARVHFVKFDFSDEASLAESLKGVSSVLFVMPQLETGRSDLLKKGIDAAVKAGVSHVVTLTAMAEEVEDCIFGKAMTGWKAYLETPEVKGKVTDLRINFFLDNFWLQQNAIKSQDSIYLNLPKGNYAHISVKDIADFAAAILLKGEKHAGQVYYPSGPVKETLDQLAASISKALGRPIKGVSVPKQAAADSMKQVLPPYVAEGSAELNELTDLGKFDAFVDQWQKSNIFEDVVGRKQQTTEQWFKNLAQAFAK